MTSRFSLYSMGVSSSTKSIFSGQDPPLSPKKEEQVRQFSQEQATMFPHTFYGPGLKSSQVIHDVRTLCLKRKGGYYVPTLVSSPLGVTYQRSVEAQALDQRDDDAAHHTSSRSSFFLNGEEDLEDNDDSTSRRRLTSHQLMDRTKRRASASVTVFGSKIRSLRQTVAKGVTATSCALAAAKQNVAIHEDSFCDGCGMDPIVGAMWTCSSCDNVHLCHKCYGHGIHGFEESAVLKVLREDAAVDAMIVASRHRVPSQVFELLMRSVCKGQLDKFNFLSEWINGLVNGHPLTQLKVQSIDIPNLDDHTRATLVSLLTPVLMERSDIEVKMEWDTLATQETMSLTDDITKHTETTMDSTTASSFSSPSSDTFSPRPDKPLSTLRIWIQPISEAMATTNQSNGTSLLRSFSRLGSLTSHTPVDHAVRSSSRRSSSSSHSSHSSSSSSSRRRSSGSSSQSSASTVASSIGGGVSPVTDHARTRLPLLETTDDGSTSTSPLSLEINALEKMGQGSNGLDSPAVEVELASPIVGGKTSFRSSSMDDDDVSVDSCTTPT